MTENDSKEFSTGWILTNWFTTRDDMYSPEFWKKFPKIKYAVGQLEVGKTMGGPRKDGLHYQVYIVLTRSQRITALIKMFKDHPDINFEIRRGTHAQAKKYVTKVYDYDDPEFKTQVKAPFEFGKEPKGRGYRTDLVSIKRKIDDGASLVQVADENFATWCRYHRSFDKYVALKRPRREEMTKGYFYYGEAGIGKSTFIKKKFPDAEYIQYDGRYFSDYNGADTIIFDDCDLDKFTRSTLLQLVNHTPYKLRCMGKYVPFNAKVVIFVANSLDSRFLHDVAVNRRFEIINLGSEKMY